MKRILMLFLAASFIAGCSSGFVYQRKANPSGDVPKLPVTVAVVAFRNDTGEYTSTGNIVGGHVFNLARTDINGVWLNTGAAFSISSLPSEKWAKSLAEDMAASGAFRSVKFLYSLSEVTNEDIVVEGALKKADFTTVKSQPDEFVLHLTVRRMPDNAVVREADVGRSGIRPSDLTGGCFMYGGCIIDRIHGYLNGIMQGIFSDVRRDLVLALAPPPEKKTDLPKESPEEVIKRILGKQ